MGKVTQGREKEIAEIICLKRAAEVGRLMLGELDGPMRPIQHEDYANKSRRELKAEALTLHSSLKKELLKFCRRNFRNVVPEDLASLYEDILAHNSRLRLPLQDFVRRLGEPLPTILKGAPSHATVCLSPWGLQTEYPEMHLARDVALTYNDAFDVCNEQTNHGEVSWQRAKDENFRRPLSVTLSRGKCAMRMCLLSCFNLAEAFVNGVAWEFIQSADSTKLSKTKLDLLTKGQVSLLEKLAKIPAIVMGQEQGPLVPDQEPLSTFRDLVKPFRDSIVHASPFSAPERFGGYDKLERVYELEMPTVTKAVELTLNIIGMIHQYLGKAPDIPAWMPVRGDEGRFVISW